MTEPPFPPPRSTPIPSFDAPTSPTSTSPTPASPTPPSSTPVSAVLPAAAADEPAATSLQRRLRLRPKRPIPWWSGVFLFTCVGVLLMPFVDPMLPRRSAAGSITGTHIERHRRTSNGHSRTVTDHVVEGRTSDGDVWETTSKELYDEVSVGDAVVVEFSRLSDHVVGVEGPGYDFDRAAGWLRYLFVVFAALMAAVAIALRPAGRTPTLLWSVAGLVGIAIGGWLGIVVVT